MLPYDVAVTIEADGGMAAGCRGRRLRGGRGGDEGLRGCAVYMSQKRGGIAAKMKFALGPCPHGFPGLAGIQPAALDYSKVIVAPCPGGLSFIRAHAPHPQGEVVVDLRFDGTDVSGTVTLPHGVGGIFKWGGCEKPLASGENRIDVIHSML